MGVINLPGGRPSMQLTGGALARLEALTPVGFDAQIDLSITDDWPLAQAFVIISAYDARVTPEAERSPELRFRSSQAIAATSDANFGIKGALATY